MKETWFWRDLPVLDAVVSAYDAFYVDGLRLRLSDIGELTHDGRTTSR